MLVDNPIQQNPFTNNYNDISDFFHTELFAPSSMTNPVSSTTPGSPGASGSASTSSRASSPEESLSHFLSTPPQEPPQTTFPDVASQDPFSFLSSGPSSSNFGFGLGGSSFFNFLDEELKMDQSLGGAASAAPYDFLSTPMASGSSDVDLNALSALFQPAGNATASSSMMAIDPQLVDTPAASEAGHDETEMAADAVKKTEPTEEKLTLTIAPVKVGGHGKARKGTVQGGGITKKVSSIPSAPASASVPAPAPAAPSSKNKENRTSPKSVDDDDDDDDLPADWRPPPEVFAKMTSKEKRQLRNKISARNFRVRRKEYITTLETDIAERDKLLQAIRSELGSTRSENLALRQEITALKRALLDGRSGASPSSPGSLLTPTSSPSASIRGIDINLNSTAVSIDDLASLQGLNLPPPAPLPERSAAEELAARASASSSPATSSTSHNLLAPNIHKDLPTSPRLGGSSFWGGVSQAGFGLGGMGGGYTPVHRVLMPDLSVSQWVKDVVAANAAAAALNSPPANPALQENMNPMLNQSHSPPSSPEIKQEPSFEGFADSNLFTMKTLDAYRMQLWTKMAAQQQQQHHHHHVHAQQPQQPQHQHQHQQREFSPSPFTLPSHQPQSGHPHLNGLASSLKPAYFVNSNKPNLSSSSSSSRPIMGSTLSALLAGKHSGSSSSSHSYSWSPSNAASAYPSPPSSPNLSGKKPTSSSSSSTISQAQATQMQQQMYAAAIATTASQTLLSKLGSAFWDAFSGGSSASTTSSSSSSPKLWDADKVRKVLEGKAVVRVVDVDPVPVPVSSSSLQAEKDKVKGPMPTQTQMQECSCHVTSLLEESMRSLTLSAKK
ncbi:hypothetical protein D9758_006920 [Tetrapyrgos nigripes]|uniref:BZIP domain-containing protein n=1 Tax=Tetrapyrgos nigripes TaxID=182062 RepID=A0A8H5GSV1_9AGAR|nr:hypothetical protein D9758_006920 [Tetrapyrgos nigripes]